MGGPNGDDDSDPGPNRIERTYDESTPASVAIVMAIAALEDVPPTASPTDLGFTLYDYVDPEALDALLETENERANLRVELAIDEYAVRVDDGGRIRVSRAER